MNRIIVDSNYLCYRSFYRFSDFEFEKKPTGVIYGFLESLLKLSRIFETKKFLFCWDSKNSYRKIIFPEYKSQRNRDEKVKEVLREKAFIQFDLLRKEILPALGFKNIFVQSGYEADDLIAEISSRYPNQYIVYSADEDLYQLLYMAGKSFLKIYKPDSGVLFDLDSFRKGTNLKNSNDWIKVKSLSGCASDNIRGIDGCGMVKAIQYILNVLPDGKVKKKIESDEGKRIYDFNFKLVALPFGGIKPVCIKKIEENEIFYSLNFMDVFKSFGLYSFVNNFEKWRERFGLLRGNRS